jgi:hypothetical protein
MDAPAATSGRHLSLTPALALRAVAAALCLASALYAARLLEPDLTRFPRAMAFSGIALVALLAATWPSGRIRLDARAWWQSVLAARVDLAAALALTALAAVLRLYNLGRYPPSNGMIFEEAQDGGIGYKILHGGYIPIEHPSAGYLAALGFLLHDETIDAMRLPFVLLGIAATVPFYFLMRELVSRPAAIFATALFAGSRWLIFGANHADELFSSIVFEVTLLYVVARGLRTANPWYGVAAGALGGVLMYEYVSYHVLPPFLLVSLAVLAVMHVAGGPRAELRDRARTWVRRWAVPALALAAAAVIALMPQWYESRRGNLQFGYSSFERDEAAREEGYFGGALPYGWSDRAQKGVETFTIGGDGRFDGFKEKGEALVDPITAVLLVISIVYAVTAFWRPWRLFFALWFAGVVLFGTAVPLNYHPGRMTTAVPAVFVLIGLLVDDAAPWLVEQVKRRRRNIAPYVWPALGFVAAVTVALNVWALESHARDDATLAFYNDRTYTTCRELIDSGIFAHTWSEQSSTDGLFVPSDYTWACKDVKGRALSGFTQLWGLGRGGDEDVVVAFLGVPPTDEAFQQVILRAYPGFQSQPQVFDGYNGQHLLTLYRIPADVLRSREGLIRGIRAADGTVPFRTLDTMQGTQPGAAGDADAEWQGMVYVPRSLQMRLAPSGNDAVEIDLDGAPSHRPGRGGDLRSVSAGWHTVEARGRFTPSSAPFSLAWLTLTSENLVSTDDLFSWGQLRGLTHQYRFTDARGASAVQEIGWPLSYTVTGAAQAELARGGGSGVYTGELWRGSLDIGRLGLPIDITARAATVTVLIDGAPVLGAESPNDSEARTEAPYNVPPGRHSIEIQVERVAGPDIGGVRMTTPGRPLAELMNAMAPN